MQARASPTSGLLRKASGGGYGDGSPGICRSRHNKLMHGIKQGRWPRAAHLVGAHLWAMLLAISCLGCRPASPTSGLLRKAYWRALRRGISWHQLVEDAGEPGALLGI